MGFAVGDVLLDRTRAFCPECLAEVDGAYFETAGGVELRRHCPEHGTTKSPFWADAEHHAWTMQVEATAAARGDGACCAPGTPGCGGDPASRRCVTVLPVTDACNLECPYCFAGSGPGQAHRPLDEVERMLDRALAAMDGPAPLQLSGGEPTVHPQILEIVRSARKKGFMHIEVNTNGVLVATREGFAESLKAAGVDALYLQFDGTDDAAYQATRAAGLWQTKQQAVEAARKAGLTVVLVPTVVRGRNDDRLGDMLRFALANVDVVRGVNVQPVRHFGRYAEDTGHLSLDEVAKLMAEQTGWFGRDELHPVPCCSATCYLATILLPAGDGAVPLTRFVEGDLFYRALESVGERRFMDVLAGTPEARRVAEDVACACGIPLGDLAGRLVDQALMVSVTGFMDAHSADAVRMERCCVNVVTRAGELAPFCGYYLTDSEGNYAWRDRHYPEEAQGTAPPAPSSPKQAQEVPRAVTDA